MTEQPQPVLLFSMPNLSQADIDKLNTNYEDIHNAVPDDLLHAFIAQGRALTPNVTVNILSGSTQWLANDGSNYYLMRVDGTALDVYSVTAGAYSVLLAKAKTASGVTSLVIITTACHAIVDTTMSLPSGIRKPDCFDPLVEHLDAAKVLATEWVEELAPDMTALLPNKVINYDTQYNAITASIIKIADANPMAKGKDDPNVKNVFELISALKTNVGQIHDDISAEDAKLLDWGQRMQVAHDNLAGGVASIQAAEADLAADIGKMNADISRLQALIEGENKAIAAAAIAVGVGVFVAIVGAALAVVTLGAGAVVAGIGIVAVVGGAVTWGIMQAKINDQYNEIAADQKQRDVDKHQLIALKGLEMATTSTVSSIATATSALSSVRAMWKLFEGELEGVLDQLNQADTGLALIVNEAFVNGAQQEWQLAAQLSQQLLAPPAVAGGGGTLPMDIKVPAAA